MGIFNSIVGFSDGSIFFNLMDRVKKEEYFYEIKISISVLRENGYGV
jgi:hypothetical protein